MKSLSFLLRAFTPPAIGVALGILFTPMIAFAQDVAASDPNVTELAQTLYSAIVNRQWWVLAVGVVILIVWAVREYGSRFFPQLEPILKNPIVSWALPIVFACLGGVLTALVAGLSIQDALGVGLKIGLTAIGAYVGKKKYDEHLENKENAAKEAAAAVPNRSAAIDVLKRNG